MSARANHFSPRHGANAQLPAALKIVLTLLCSTLFLALVLLGGRHAGAPSHINSQAENNLK